MIYKNLLSAVLAIICIGTPFCHAVEISDEDSGKIARVVGFLLSQTHYKRSALDDEISKEFLRKYMESLDYSRMFFSSQILMNFQKNTVHC